MRNLVRWQPFGDLVSLRDAMDHLFEDSFVSPRQWPLTVGWATPTLDVYETANDVVVKAALPGIKPEEIEITLTGNLLTLQGETKEQVESKDKSYIRHESRYGSFARSIELPDGLQGDKAEAKFEDGILTLSIPKSEEVKPKSIKIKTKEN